MKTYEGKRTIDGLVVTVDGKQLDEHYEVKRFTKYGFEWTYEGESPQQLALAILFDYLGDRERAIRLSESFMRDVVANLDNDWTISSEEIDTFLRGSGTVRPLNVSRSSWPGLTRPSTPCFRARRRGCPRQARA